MTKTPTTSASAPRSRGCVVCIARSPPRSAGSPCPSTDSSADASTAHVGPACGTKISSAGRRGRARRPARRGRSSVSLRRAGREDGVPRAPSYCALVHAEDDQGPVAARRRGPGPAPRPLTDAAAGKVDVPRNPDGGRRRRSRAPRHGTPDMSARGHRPKDGRQCHEDEPGGQDDERQALDELRRDRPVDHGTVTPSPDGLLRRSGPSQNRTDVL